MDKISIDRIKLLHPAVREEVGQLFDHINRRILGKGVRLRLAYTYRSFDEQNDLYALGRTKLFDNKGKRLGKVTNAKGGSSVHNFGLAFDIVLLLDKDNNGTFESASWDIKADFDKDGKADWMEVTNYLIANGWEWGGNWRFVDPPHFQKTFCHTTKSLLEKLNKGHFTTEVINGQTYKWVNL